MLVLSHTNIGKRYKGSDVGNFPYQYWCDNFVFQCWYTINHPWYFLFVPMLVFSFTNIGLTIEEALNSTSFSLKKIESGQGYSSRKDHVYWDQVQGQMYLFHRLFCIFVVWTTKDVAVLKNNRKG